MGRNIKADTRELKELRARLEKLASDAQVQQFCESCSKELAARLLALVIKRTPVGRYPEDSEKKGGTLRRGWTSRTAEMAALKAEFLGGSGATSKFGSQKAVYGTGALAENVSGFAQSLQVKKNADTYTITVQNPVEYASYVEFGHRTRGKGGNPGTGWVPGKFFLTISEDELEHIAPRVLEKKLEAFLQGVFNGTT